MASTGSRFLALLVAILASLGAARPTTAQTVTTFGDFDLLGWSRVGAATIETGTLDRGGARDLVDGDTGTLVRAVDNPARIAVVLEPAQVVRRTVLVPGSNDPYAVSCVVVSSDGRRFAAGEVVVQDRTPATFRLLDVPLVRVEFEVERLERDDVVHVAEIRVHGELTIDELVLDELPASLPIGGGFPVTVRGRDAFGGQPDMTPLATLVVSPDRGLAFLDQNRWAVTRVGGPITITPRLQALEGQKRSVLVTTLDDAPPAPTVHAGLHVVQVDFAGRPPFEVLRRGLADKAPQSLGKTWAHSWFDRQVSPGTAYHYAVRGVDHWGNPLTKTSDESRARVPARTPPGGATLWRLPVLVVVFVDSFGARMPGVRASLEEARRFVHRHTGGRLVLDLTLLELPGQTPAFAGPDLSSVEQQLRRMGVDDEHFGALVVLAADAPGSYGNINLSGRWGGVLARPEEVPTMPGAAGPEPGVAYAFVHELQHVLVYRVAPTAGRADLPTGHFADDYAEGRLGGASGRHLDVGEGWDAAAALYGQLDFFAEAGEPYRQPLEVIDGDGDGLADVDPRLPIDEARLGTDPDAVDSDGDGLTDMAELAAGAFRECAPRAPDTDGDGLPDGVDPFPLGDATLLVEHGVVPRRVASGPEFRMGFVQLSACWTEQQLVLEVSTPVACDVWVDLDGSGALGRWESDVRVGGTSDVWAGPARLALRAHVAPLGVFVGSRPVERAQVEASERDGRSVLVARIPFDALGPGAGDVFVPADAPTVPGLRLVPGTVLGLAVTARPAEEGPADPFDPYAKGGRWIGLFEPGRLVDVVLREPPARPAGTPAPGSQPDGAPEAGSPAEEPPPAGDGGG